MKLKLMYVMMAGGAFAFSPCYADTAGADAPAKEVAPAAKTLDVFVVEAAGGG